MSLIKAEISPQLWREFRYYADGGADGFSQLDVAPGKLWRLAQIRLHTSTAFASVEDLVLYISSVNGSQYNHKILSAAMNGIQTYILGWTEDQLRFYSDDTLVINFSQVSATNAWGLEVHCWAVAGNC